jgi:CRP/FNR family cyclic AMP-dependent transcriptional regulator
LESSPWNLAMNEALKAKANLELEELTTLAKRFSDQRMYDEAAELFHLASRLDPKNLGLKLSLAQVRKLQKLDSRGERNFDDLVQEEDRRNHLDASHFLGLASLYQDREQTTRAIECIEIARSKAPDHPSLHPVRAQILFAAGDFAGAAESYAKARRLDPFGRELAENLGRAEMERKSYIAALAATIDALHLLSDAAMDDHDRLRRRIRTLKQILDWSNEELSSLFHERREFLGTAFDRLEWHRERFEGTQDQLIEEPLQAQPPQHDGAGQIELAARLRRLAFWEQFSDEQIFRLTDAIVEEAYARGDFVFEYGSRGRDLYVLEQGEIAIQRPTSYGTYRLGTLQPMALFGEANFIYPTRRLAEAVATQPTQLLRLDTALLDPLVQEHPDIGVQLYWHFWHGLATKLRQTNEELANFFGEEAPENFVKMRSEQDSGSDVEVDSSDKIRIFTEQGLGSEELIALATFSRERQYGPGEYLFQEGDKGDEMYVIVEGRALISKFIPGGGEEALAILERGDFFGEMSLIDGQPRSADAKSHRGPLTVLALDQATINEVLNMEPESCLEFLQLLCRLLAKRLGEIDEKLIGWRIMSGTPGDAEI